MFYCRPNTLWFTASLFCCLQLLVPARLRAADPNGAASPDPRATLLAIWQGQANEIITGRFRTKVYRCVPRGKLTRDELAKTLESLNLANRPEDWAKLRSLFPPPDPNIAEFWGTAVEVLEEGGKGRNNWKYSIQEKPVTEAHVFNNQEDVEYNAFDRQALIMPGKSSVHMIHSWDLRYLPIWDPRHPPEQFAIQERAGGRLTLAKDDYSVVVDESNGFVYYSRRTVSKADTREIYQYGPRKFAGDVLLPTVKIETHADGTGRVQWFGGYQLTDAEINIPLPEDTFTVSIPADTNVVDLRKDRNNPLSRVTDRAVSDVIRYADAAILHAQPEATPALSPRRVLWLTSGSVFGVGLIVLGIRLLRKPRTAA